MIAALAVWLGALGGVAGFAAIPRRVPDRARVGRARDQEVVLLRPCAGAEPELARCLASWPSHAGPAPRVIFAVGSPEDAALPVAEAAALRLRDRGVDATVLVTEARGPNHKAAQLAVAAGAAIRADVLVVADSDVDLEGLDLGAIVDPIAADDRVAACWAPPVEHGAARTLGDRASQALLGASLHAFPLLARLDGGGMVGKLCALRATSLAAAGGFASLVDVLGEDMELARRFARRGEKVAVARVTARSLASGRTLVAVAARYARWIAVVRRQRPLLLASYPLLFAATPLISTAALVAGAPAIALGAIALRIVVALVAQGACGRRRSVRGAIVESGLADALLLAGVRAGDGDAGRGVAGRAAAGARGWEGSWRSGHDDRRLRAGGMLKPRPPPVPGTPPPEAPAAPPRRSPPRPRSTRAQEEPELAPPGHHRAPRHRVVAGARDHPPDVGVDQARAADGGAAVAWEGGDAGVGPDVERLRGVERGARRRGRSARRSGVRRGTRRRRPPRPRATPWAGRGDRVARPRRRRGRCW